MEKYENYEAEDALVKMVNSKQAEDTYFRNLEASINASIKYEERLIEQDNARKKAFEQLEARNKSIEQRRKKALLSVSLLVASLLPGIIVGGVKINDWIQKQMMISKATNVLCEDARENLILSGCAALEYNTGKPPFVLKDNSVSDYKNLVYRIGNVESKDVYVYASVFESMGQKDEIDDFVSAIPYTTDEGTYYYLDFDHYLSVNGYPDTATFENYVEGEIFTDYVNGNLNKYTSEVVEISHRGGR